jgi:hypothetical protein
MADKFKFKTLTDHYDKTVMKTLDPKSSFQDAKNVYELRNLIQTIEDVKGPRYERMRIILDSITKAAIALLKDKLVKKLPPEKGVKQLISKVKMLKSQVVKEERAYERSGTGAGLVEVDISFNAVDFSNTPVGGAALALKVDAHPRPVKLTSRLSGGAVRFRGIMIEPSGNANAILLLNRNVAKKMQANLSYKGLKKGKTLLISATEDKKEKKYKKGSGQEAAESAGVKGTVGVDFKVFNGSTELTSSKELKKSESKEVEFTVSYPTGKLTLSHK